MRKLSSILLLVLMFLPVIWNGLSLLHFVVEHTHTFCESDADHEHTSLHDCMSFCHITKSQENNQFLSKIEFSELKPCINPLSSFIIQSFSFSLVTTMNESPFLLGRNYSNDIFHPPIL